MKKAEFLILTAVLVSYAQDGTPGADGRDGASRISVGISIGASSAGEEGGSASRGKRCGGG
jgi:hypothetical protein